MALTLTLLLRIYTKRAVRASILEIKGTHRESFQRIFANGTQTVQTPNNEKMQRIYQDRRRAKYFHEVQGRFPRVCAGTDHHSDVFRCEQVLVQDCTFGKRVWEESGGFLNSKQFSKNKTVKQNKTKTKQNCKKKKTQLLGSHTHTHILTHFPPNVQN